MRIVNPLFHKETKRLRISGKMYGQHVPQRPRSRSKKGVLLNNLQNILPYGYTS